MNRHLPTRRYERVLRAITVPVLALLVLAACGNPSSGATTQAPATTTALAPATAQSDDAATPAPAATTPADGASAPASGEPIAVVATFSILGDLVQNVGGDLVALRTLVPAGGDAHTFEPSPTDSVALVDAAVIFENGLAFESWLPDLYAASRSQATRVVVTEGIETIAAHDEHEDEHADEGTTAEADHDDDEHADEGMTAEADHANEGSTADADDDHADDHDDDHEHGEFDPHVWHDVHNVEVMVGHIRDGLAAADPANAATYQANAARYIEELGALDTYVQEQTATLPAERRKLVTTHDTFAYFARHYGYEVVGTALGATSTEVADPSAADLARLVDEIKATGVPAIFAENVSNPDLIERVANEAGVEVGSQLYTDALSEPGTDGDTYIKMIRYNIDAIVSALSA